jgi:hypothetical protein
MITVAEVIGSNRYYIFFKRPLNDIQSQQLMSLYNLLSRVFMTTFLIYVYGDGAILVHLVFNLVIVG